MHATPRHATPCCAPRPSGESWAVTPKHQAPGARFCPLLLPAHPAVLRSSALVYNGFGFGCEFFHRFRPLRACSSSITNSSG